MSDKNKKQDPLPESLHEGDRVQPGHGDTSNDKYEEILHLIHKNGGLPVTINPVRVKLDHHDEQGHEIEGISRFIKRTRISFNSYKVIMDDILNCGLGALGEPKRVYSGECEDEKAPGVAITKEKSSSLLTNDDKVLFRNGALFSSSKAYSILKYATEKFVYTTFGLDPEDIGKPPGEVLPYIALIEAKLSDACCKCDIEFRPIFAELIWNYWHEEGMLMHSVNAIARRFQNKRSHRGNDPLANLSLDPLRPLNNLVWGYIQDANNRLTSTRMAFEYDHEYGLSLFATDGIKSKTADSRSFFIQAFHGLLYKCAAFYKEADNIFKVPDAFPVLNALREVHLVLSEGAGNQFGDLPATARAEMLLAQYILGRPETREFIGGRVMVPYDEVWMDRVDSMKTLQGWPGASISYYHDLAVYGEEILLSIRWISWTQVNNRDVAREWALIFRDAIQRYIHCYQAVTGVDLSAMEVSGSNDEKALMPSLLIGRKVQRDAMMRRR
ncbi:MAG TPA: hypothetical protein VK644_05130 [Chitinophagaceae bacterium]|nr:hypothetical protein [Chitinophagaceae bacterium]